MVQGAAREMCVVPVPVVTSHHLRDGLVGGLEVNDTAGIHRSIAEYRPFKALLGSTPLLHIMFLMRHGLAGNRCHTNIPQGATRISDFVKLTTNNGPNRCTGGPQGAT